MFDDYTKLVLQNYEKKKAMGELPLNLSKPTPARLRDECLTKSQGNVLRKDLKILRDFFGQVDNEAAYPRAIKNCDIDRFRPLINFLKKPAIKTDERNVELLAWLIDFEPRPNEYDRMYSVEAETGENNVESAAEQIREQDAERVFAIISPDPDIEAEDQRLVGVPPGQRHHFRMIAASLTAIVLVLVSILIYNNAGNGNGGSCMYWIDDHYEQIPCGQKVYGTLVVALDSQKLLHFKKITRPDTITEADINRIFYIKYNGKIEFYTGRGEHPVYTERSLKPLTEHIYIQHILPLKQQ